MRSPWEQRCSCGATRCPTRQAELTRDIACCFVAVAPCGSPGSSSDGSGSGGSGSGGSGSSGFAGSSDTTTDKAAHHRAVGAGSGQAPAAASLSAAAVGFVVGWLVAGELQVMELAVHPGHRRQGVGAALLAHLLRQCRRAWEGGSGAELYGPGYARW